MDNEVVSEFVRVFETALIDVVDVSNIQPVIDCLYATLKDYSIIKTSTELTIYVDKNSRMLKEFGACLLVEGKSKKTVIQYIRAMQRLFEFTGKAFDEISVNDIRGYLATMILNGTKKVSTNNIRNYIAAFYKWAYAEKLIEVNPCDNIANIKSEQEIKYPYSDIEIDLMRNQLNNLRDRAIFEVLLSSGIRINELTSLNKSDLDLDAGKLIVRCGKGGKDRISYLSHVACHHLNLYLDSRMDSSEAVFLNYNNRDVQFKDRISNSGVRKLLSALGKKSKVSNVHPHRFRRTFATSLYHRGMNPVDIQQLLGHSSISTTMTYIHCDDTNLKAAYLKYGT